MASPLSSDDRRWIREFVRFQVASDQRVAVALRQASQDAEAALQQLEGKAGVGAAVRRAQLASSRGAIQKALHALYVTLGTIIREEQGDAAALAEELMIRDEGDLWTIIESDPKKREYLQQTLQDTARRQVQAMMTRILKSERTLSERIYKSEAGLKTRLSRTLNSHLARGSSASDIAKDVRGFFAPNVPGGVNYAAKRLARTEINNAFHAQSIADSESRPWVQQVQWNLSKSHPERQAPCACDRYAAVRLWPANDVPRKPHPNCLCSITPVVPDFDTAFNNFLSGQYQEWIDEVMQPS